MVLMFIITQVILICILRQYCQRSVVWNKMSILFVHCMGIARAQYNVKNLGKHEILLFDTCLLYLYFPTDWVGKYLGNYHNNVTHISGAVAHDV